MEIVIRISVEVDGNPTVDKTIKIDPLIEPTSYDDLPWYKGVRNLALDKGVKNLTMQRFKWLEGFQQDDGLNKDTPFSEFRKYYFSHLAHVERTLGAKTFARLRRVMEP